ncbi:MAG: tRNA (adenosine(37)-N6)-dimethylallyltransferase MiaA [Tenericutes bacterium HGW-Tenericutes-6]|nr:MAG: tRNA (adenosine(37)-N6)-dimethylallyltransferase MiaA [Tenericutes bacterium HGW-Tenericutes-6]
MKKILVIVGPTGSGKTRLSIELAKAFHAEIINGDSVQVYKGLDIGSAKIKPLEMQGVKHHLLSIKDPKEPYSVYEFQQDSRRLFETIDLPMIVGGTGLYIKASLYDYEFIDPKRNDHFDDMYQSYSNDQLYELLLNYDPLIKIDPQNRRRVLRALEHAINGTPRSKKQKKDHLLYDACIIYLDLERDLLEPRLRQRLDQQIEEGFIEEVQALMDQGISINAIGYRELERYLKQEISLEEAKDQIIQVSKKLAKKQKTFFKNQMHPIMLDAMSKTLIDDAIHIVSSFLKEV